MEEGMHARENDDSWQPHPVGGQDRYVHPKLGQIRQSKENGTWRHYGVDGKLTHSKPFDHYSDAAYHAENLGRKKIKEAGTTTTDAMGYQKPMAIPVRRALRSRRKKPKKTGDSYLKGKFESKKPK